jgi:hypothetical protein
MGRALVVLYTNSKGCLGVSTWFGTIHTKHLVKYGRLTIHCRDAPHGGRVHKAQNLYVLLYTDQVVQFIRNNALKVHPKDFVSTYPELLI